MATVVERGETYKVNFMEMKAVEEQESVKFRRDVMRGKSKKSR